MIRLLTIEYMKDFSEITIIPDSRSIKVKSKNSLLDYLQIHLWFDEGVQTKLYVYWEESKNDRNLQFVDYIAKIVFGRYEDNQTELFNRLEPHIIHKTLFF